MRLEEIVRRHGALAVLVFAGLVGLFVALHLVRLPLLALAAVLSGAMRLVDAAVTTRLATTTPTRPAWSAAAGGGVGGGR